jgi:hypothetical protein
MPTIDPSMRDYSDSDSDGNEQIDTNQMDIQDFNDIKLTNSYQASAD